MKDKWPFILITLGLLFALGYTIASLERNTVMKNWSTRRCDLSVMTAAMFFKPDTDPRSSTQFATDNFDFCLKTTVDKFTTLFMAPINAIFSQHLDATSSAVNMVNTVRDIAQKLYTTLSSYLDQFFKQFNTGIFEISRIIQYLRMAVGRVNAIAMSTLYTGITLFHGMLNSVQFVIKVILIICGIMIAIIIILFFILFPVIPIIMATLSAVVATVLGLSMVMESSIADQANSDKGGFCFSKDTKIGIIDTNGTGKSVSVQDIKIGDKLATNCGEITAIIVMSGKDVPLFDLNGILVSGSHLVQGIDGKWISVAKDKRAIKTDKTSNVLYCFNTTTRKIPIIVPKTTEIQFFRDWEEIADDDVAGQYLWCVLIHKMLNNDKNYELWKNGLCVTDDIPLIGTNIKIKTMSGYKDVSNLNLGDTVIDKNGKEQKILGIVYGTTQGTSEDNIWNTELYELRNTVWIKGESTVMNGKNILNGMMLITESGEFTIWDEVENKEKVVRDFTEVGYNQIYKTYSFVESRLRSFEHM